MRTYGGVAVWIHVFLTSALVGGEWAALLPVRFIPGRAPQLLTGQEAGWDPEPLWTIWGR